MVSSADREVSEAVTVLRPGSPLAIGAYNSPSEAVREGLLLTCENVHRERATLLDDLVGAVATLDAHQDEGRVEGERGEGAGRHTVVTAIWGDRGDYSYP